MKTSTVKIKVCTIFAPIALFLLCNVLNTLLNSHDHYIIIMLLIY